jgi:hypothetical protein
MRAEEVNQYEERLWEYFHTRIRSSVTIYLFSPLNLQEMQIIGMLYLNKKKHVATFQPSSIFVGKIRSLSFRVEHLSGV